MTITEITRIANNYTDEVFTNLVCLDFANEAISNINIALGATLPNMTISGDYTALAEQWIRTVIVPYVSYSIKLNDGSVNESQVNFLQRYERGMKELRKNKRTAIDDAYKSSNFGGVVQMPKLGTYEEYPDED
jgi:hypothetical protein